MTARAGLALSTTSARGADAAVDVGGHVVEVADPLGELGEERQRAGEAGEHGLQVASGLESGSDVEKLRRVEDAAEVGLVGEGADVVDAAQAGARLHLAQVAGLGG